jgi:hypothetical protein
VFVRDGEKFENSNSVRAAARSVDGFVCLGLPFLTSRDANSNETFDAFDFVDTPSPPQPLQPRVCP